MNDKIIIKSNKNGFSVIYNYDDEVEDYIFEQRDTDKNNEALLNLLYFIKDIHGDHSRHAEYNIYILRHYGDKRDEFYTSECPLCGRKEGEVSDES